ncbi:MAG: biopolymer transporter ExbD [Bacteroidetes bacterium]|nr:biopolymer transporter ExbD [Bacteroidota bacterium]
MPKVKVPRKSTIVDMTAMCDVSFLLLTFFILTAKFKPQSLVAVDVPVARSTKTFSEAVTITISKEGKTYVGVKETVTRYSMLEQMIEKFGDKYPALKTLTENQKRFFSLVDMWGTPIADMPRVLSMDGSAFKHYQEKEMPGVPKDSLDNQLVDWVQAARYATDGNIKIAIKSDKNTSVGPVKEVIKGLTSRDIHRFLLVTTLSGDEAAAPEEDLDKVQ